MAALKLIRNADRTITVVVGRYRETISEDGKTTLELYDAVMWAAITGGASVDDSLWDHIQQLRAGS